MLYKRKIKGLTVAEIWFETPKYFSSKKYAFNNYYSMLKFPALKKGERCLIKRDAQTLVTDLTESEESLLLHCDSDVRTKIRRAQKDGVVCLRYTSEELLSENALLRKFDETYAEMHKQKGMCHNSVRSSIKQRAATGPLFLSVCKIEEEIVAYHIYVAGDNIVRLLYTVSAFRGSSDSTARNAIGRANRLLHYEDMLYFKKLGFSLYDWGGYSSDPELFGINEFKKGFGGELANRYFITASSKWWVFVLFALRKLIKGEV